MKMPSFIARFIGFAGVVTTTVFGQSAFVPASTRTDMVHDFASDLIYITNGNSILRYHAGADAMIDPVTLQGPLRGIDLSRDGRTLAVASAAVSATENWIYLIDISTGAVERVTFPRSSGETGTFTVAWSADGKVYVSSSFGGSGWVPLRCYDPVTRTTTIVRSSVEQDTMLQFSSNGRVLATVGANNSGGPFATYDPVTSVWRTGRANWFTFEVGINRDGSQLAVPTYSGMFVYDASFTKLATVGTYAGALPLAVAYHPVEPLMYLPFAQTSTVRIYNTGTFTPAGEVEAGATFPWVGNWAFQSGRIKLSLDGSLLMVTVEGGVRVVRLHAPLKAYDSVASVLEDQPTAVTLQAEIGNGGQLEYEVVDGPWHGTLTGTGATRTYTPAPNYFGSDVITFRVRYGEAVRQGSVSLDVLPQNDAPVAVNDAASMKRNGTATIPVLVNDFDIDGDPLALTAVSKPTAGTANIVGSSIVFVPPKSFTGVATFRYTIVDGKGASASGTVTVTVTK